MIELRDVGQDGQTVGRASGHVGHLQEGGDPQPDLSSEESELAVPGKIVESFYSLRHSGSSGQQRQRTN